MAPKLCKGSESEQLGFLSAGYVQIYFSLPHNSQRADLVNHSNLVRAMYSVGRIHVTSSAPLAE